MKISKSTVVLLVLILIFSILMANIVDFINIDPYLPDETLGENNGEIQSKPKYYKIGSSYSHLIWFLQITDIHISIFRDPSRLLEFKEFCNVTVNSIQPRVVLASGDLTDAILQNRFGSKQQHQEWQHYRYVIDETNVSKKTLWLDVRGNHDNFDIINFDSKNNYYSYYSIQGKNHLRSYMYNVNIGPDTFSFIAIDACLKPGPKRPFNFIGILDQDEINRIQDLINRSKESNAAHAIVFGHYPTSSIISRSDTNIRSILGSHRESMVYLCGHYHTLGNMVPNMYTLQKTGFLELELADWKENRMYRLAALDHGQFSFIDIKHGDWPVALITNPKNVLFMMPQKENLESIIKSTHVRVLAFSTVPLKTVEVQLDNDAWEKCYHVDGPLYVLPWNSTRYKEGIHQITVRVIDNEDRKKIVSHSFSLDGSWLSTSVFPKLLLMINIVYVFQFLFLVTLALSIIPLCFLRFVHMRYRNKRIELPRRRMKFFHLWLRKLWILSAIDRVFFGLILYTIYFAIGPWTIGEIIENHVGVIFVWGTFIGNMYLPGGLTYAYGFLQLIWFHMPLTLILAHYVDRRLRDAECPSRVASKFRIAWRFLPILLLVLLQFVFGYFLYLEYGTLAILLCPLRTGSILIAVALSYSIATMPVSCLRSAASVWCPNGAIDNNNATRKNISKIIQLEMLFSSAAKTNRQMKYIMDKKQKIIKDKDRLLGIFNGNMPRKAAIPPELAIQTIKNFMEYFKTDPLPAWSHKVWKDMSTVLGNKWSFQTCWINVYYDRNSILSIAREAMGIVVPPKLHQNIKNPDLEESTISNRNSDGDTSFELCFELNNNKEKLDTFDLVLTEQQWNEIKPDIIKSDTKTSSGRSKLQLKPGVWTNEISTSFWQQFRLPCAFIFKRAEVILSPDDMTYTIKMIGSCKSKVCGNIFRGDAEKHIDVDGLTIQIKTRDTRFQNHEIVKRPLNGQRRKKVQKELKAEGCSVWRKRYARENMRFGETEPPL